MLILISTITGIVGAFLLANKVFLIGYIFFLVGSICAVLVTYKKDRILSYQFMFYTLCNVLGLYNNI